MKCLICGAPVKSGAACPKCWSSVFSTKPTTKYNAWKVVTEDGVFDSKLECRRWNELKLLEKAGAITELKRQVRLPLISKSRYGKEIAYIADFTYLEGEKLVVEDTKSEATKTPLYRLKKRLVAEKYGIVIKEITK